MHLTIKDQEKDGRPAIMCIERPIRVCIVLNGSPEEADTFATLAGALGVTDVLVLAKRKGLEEFFERGWLPEQEFSLLVKRLGGKT